MKDLEKKIKDIEAWSHANVLKLAQDLLRQNAALKDDNKMLLDVLHEIWRKQV